jgi:hypothetical protein
VDWAADSFHRRADDGLPDLFVEWDAAAPIDRVWSPALGTLSRPTRFVRTGMHDPAGELLALGPGISPGRRDAIVDQQVAPTIAAAAGVFLRDRDEDPAADLVPHGGRLGARLASSIARLERADDVRDRTARADRREQAALRRDLLELRRDLQGLLAAHHETRVTAEHAASAGRLAVDAAATSAWIASVDVPTTARISVIVPTHNRAALLPRAIASVVASSYPNWELIVVDDASTDSTSDALAPLTDPRIQVVMRNERGGECRTRNAGLDVATGDLVTFLDDDNTFAAEWLRSVAWLFHTRPEITCAYGIRVIEDAARHEGADSSLPMLQLNEWDREVLLERNLVDINVLAHRRGATRFDPELTIYGDWDYLLALTKDAPAVALPAFAASYFVSAPARSTDTMDDQKAAMYARVRDRWAR